jgi:hypothetical protein
MDPRKVVVEGRYLRPGDELESHDGGRMMVDRVDERRMSLRITTPDVEASTFNRVGVIVLDDEDCAKFTNENLRWRRVPNERAA